MTKRSEYYEFWDDKLVPRRWYLNGMTRAGEPFDHRVFNRAGRVQQPFPDVRISLRRRGVPMEFTLGDDGTPVANERVAAIIKRIAGPEVLLFPAQVDEQEKPYVILVAQLAVECVDKSASEELTYFTEEDNRPNRLGEYKSIGRLRIDRRAAAGHHFFRVKGWEVALIVSEQVRIALEEAHVSGLCFVPV